MALSFGNTITTDWKYTVTGAAASSINADIPSMSSGELLVLVCTIMNSGSSFSTPSGFTSNYSASYSDGGLGVFWKTCTGSEGSTITVSRSGGTNAYIAVIALRLTGHDTTTPFNKGTSQAGVGGGANWNSPDLGSTTANGCLLFFGGLTNQGAPAWDSGDEPDTTTLVTQQSPGGGWLGLAFESQTSAGATGTRLWTNPQYSKSAFSFALAPGASSAPRRIRPATSLASQAATVAGTGTVS
jgi:hypothetical protein